MPRPLLRNVITKHNIQKTHIHIFYNIAGRSRYNSGVVSELQNSARADVAMRAKVIFSTMYENKHEIKIDSRF